MSAPPLYPADMEHPANKVADVCEACRAAIAEDAPRYLLPIGGGYAAVCVPCAERAA